MKAPAAGAFRVFVEPDWRKLVRLGDLLPGREFETMITERAGVVLHPMSGPGSVPVELGPSRNPGFHFPFENRRLCYRVLVLAREQDLRGSDA